MGKVKETYSSAYYRSNEEFLEDIEAGAQPSYVGLLEIVRFLKLLNRDKKSSVVKVEGRHEPDQQLCFAAQA